MPIDIKLNDRIASVEVLNQNENLLEIKVDDKIYKVDLMHNDDGLFSILENNHSHNIFLIEKDTQTYNKLKENPDWKLAYEGEVAAVFLPAAISNNKNWQIPESDPNYYVKTKYENYIDF